MNRYGRKNYPKNEDNERDDLMKMLRTYAPMSVAQILKAKSDAINHPISKLIMIAVENELESPNPFTYMQELPDIPFVQDAYAEEASKIFEFLQKIPYGIGKDSLLMCRRDMGIMSKDTFLLGFRELENSGLIESFYPKKATFTYPLDYRYWRVKQEDAKTIKRIKYKRKQIEGAQGDE